MMRNNRNRRIRFLRAPEGEGGEANGGAPVTPATPVTPNPDDDSGSLLEGGQGAVTPPVTPGDEAHAWLPDKFRVKDAEGKVDEAASARKLAESYKALEAHKGALPQVPATAADYVLEAPKDAEGKPLEGFDVEAFVSDPAFKGLAERAHAKGVTNEQLNFMVGEYLQIAPQLVAADQQLTLTEARAELAKVWPDEAAMNRNLAGVVKAIQGFGAEADDVPGSRSRLMAKYGRDPDFIAFAAQVANEMQEDRVPGGAGGVGGSDDNVEAMQKSEAYWNKNHPEHKATVAKVQEHYARKYGTRTRGR
jgi:hypothetical protein